MADKSGENPDSLIGNNINQSALTLILGNIHLHTLEIKKFLFKETTEKKLVKVSEPLSSNYIHLVNV